MPIEIDDTYIIINDGSTTSNILEVVKSRLTTQGDEIANDPTITNEQLYRSLLVPAVQYNYTNVYPSLDADATNLVAWYKFDDNTNKGLNSSVSPNSIGDATAVNMELVDTQKVVGRSSYFTGATGSDTRGLVIDNDTDKLYQKLNNKSFCIAFWFQALDKDYGRIFYGAPKGGGNNYEAIQLMVSENGGKNIENSKEINPDSIKKIYIDPTDKLNETEIYKICDEVNITKNRQVEFKNILCGLYKAFVELDASLVEINPLAIDINHKFIALDSKWNFDPNGLARQPQVLSLKDLQEEDKLEIESAN